MPRRVPQQAWAVLGLGLLVFVPDLVLRAHTLKTAPDAATYGIAALASTAIWLWMVSAIARMRERRGAVGGRCVVWLVGIALGFFTFSVFGYHVRLGLDPQPAELTFFITDFDYATALIGENTDVAPTAVLLSGMLLTAVMLDVLTRKSLPPPTRRLRIAASLGAVVLGVATLYMRMPAPADLRGLAWGLRGLAYLAVPDRELPTPARAEVPALTAARRPNVVVVLHESLSALVWKPWSPQGESSRVEAFLSAHADRALWFPRAVTNSSATNVSVPSLLSGLAPDAERSVYTKAPLLWHYARKLGYRTALFSPQALDWSNLDGFFLGEDRPDVVLTARGTEAPRVNDRGIDDALVADAFERYLAETPPSEPIFAVIQLNATHLPAYVGPQGARAQGALSWLERYRGAARYVDEITGRIQDALEARGRLQQTLLIGTSDHGEHLAPEGKPLRVETLDEPVARIPFWIHLPSELATEELRATLAANRERRVSNLDVVPTVMDAWGLWPPPAGLAWVPFAGGSLLREIDPERLIVASTVGAIRKWDRCAIAFYRDQHKWLADERGAFYFDLASDPLGEHGLLLEEAPERAAFLRTLAERPVLQAAYERTQPPRFADGLLRLGDLASVNALMQ